MPTVIDSLVVEIGLDPTKYKKGLTDALSAAAQGKEQIVKGSDEVEKHTKGVSEAFSKLRNNLLGVAVLFTGGLGIKDFVQSVTQTDIGIGRLAKVVDVSSGTLSRWRNAGLLAGGTGHSFSDVLKTITLEMARLQLTGESTIIPFFRALGVSVVDDAGKFKNATQLFLEVADAIENRKVDPARATIILQSMGADEATVSAVLKGRSALQAYLDTAEKVGDVTQEDVDAANALNQAWQEMTASSATLGRSILTALTPALVAFLNRAAAAAQSLRNGTLSPSGLSVGRWLGIVGDRLPEGGFDESGFSGVGGGRGAGLRAKAGAGTRSAAVDALARAIQAGEPDLNRFTSFNDAHHGGAGAHGRGEALDFTVTDPSRSGEVAARLRAKLAALGVDAKVVDEYASPSAGATGGHIHVQFSGAAAAAKFAAGGAQTSAAVAGGRGSSSTSTSSVTIGSLTVNSRAQDAPGIAQDIRQEIEATSFAVHANGGQQ